MPPKKAPVKKAPVKKAPAKKADKSTPVDEATVASASKTKRSLAAISEADDDDPKADAKLSEEEAGAATPAQMRAAAAWADHVLDGAIPGHFAPSDLALIVAEVHKTTKFAMRDMLIQGFLKRQRTSVDVTVADIAFKAAAAFITCERNTYSAKPYASISYDLSREKFDELFGSLGEATSCTANTHRRVCTDAGQIAQAFGMHEIFRALFTGPTLRFYGDDSVCFTVATFESLTMKHAHGKAEFKFRTRGIKAFETSPYGEPPEDFKALLQKSQQIVEQVSKNMQEAAAAAAAAKKKAKTSK
jgi:hypothetical protein